ncbi:hypothetical protein E2K80_01690 [Rhodophyticola sp. CCM32]|uniref:phosphate/phosphite/phosphonate ABC transporter substrate-binding protein n=1 Tax=Rhodophyticola sp. CCM32 TaxID=2916397 RepID=UPI00107FA41C|nr:PhnD/SsuA/transferrin family substrate-binding protein [Rhodophyticola sp. CCM32]QBX99589.1 hypothetical protein E2K80_01690 [Rhodophyticola sp. CCM32]
MIAALPMYDRAETRGATDRLWALIARALQDQGVDAPATLIRDTDPWEIWQSPDLILAQTCGLPYRARLAPHVTLIATPDYALPGCPPGHYNSVIIARAADAPAGPSPAPHPAVNDPLSQSGWAALSVWAIESKLDLKTPLITGAHEASARAVVDGQADLAAIDAQTWRLLTRYAPWTANLTEIARTAPTPGLPLISAKTRDPEPIRKALHNALEALAPADRQMLDLQGFPIIPKAAYLAQPIPPAL